MACLVGAQTEEVHVRLLMAHLGEDCPVKPCPDCEGLLRQLNELAAQCEGRGCRLDACVNDTMA